MESTLPSARDARVPPIEYAKAIEDLERRAAQGRLTLAEARTEMISLREKFEINSYAVAQWAAASQCKGRAISI